MQPELNFFVDDFSHFFQYNFQALVNQVETLRIECEKLQSANTELHRHRDQLEDEKDDIIKDKLRQIKENERWYAF